MNRRSFLLSTLLAPFAAALAVFKKKRSPLPQPGDWIFCHGTGEYFKITKISGMTEAKLEKQWQK